MLKKLKKGFAFLLCLLIMATTTQIGGMGQVFAEEADDGYLNLVDATLTITEDGMKVCDYDGNQVGSLESELSANGVSYENGVLTLNNTKMKTSTSKGLISISGIKQCNIKIQGDVSLLNANGYGATIDVVGKVIINGNGTLNITHGGGVGIGSKNYPGKADVEIADININIENNGAYYLDPISIKGKDISISNAKMNSDVIKYCIYAQNSIRVSNSDLNLSQSYAYQGSPIHVDNADGSLYIKKSTIDVKGGYDGIHSNGETTFENSNIKAVAKREGVYSGKDLTIDGGNLNVVTAESRALVLYTKFIMKAGTVSLNNEGSSDYIINYISDKSCFDINEGITSVIAGTTKETATALALADLDTSHHYVLFQCKHLDTEGKSAGVAKNAKEATYTSEGYTGDIYCKSCGEKLADGQAIPKLTPKAPKPHIEGTDNTDIKEAVANATEGAINIDMNGTKNVDGDAIKAAKGKNVSLVFNMGNGIKWTVNGKNVKSDSVANINMALTVGAEAGKAVPTTLVDEVKSAGKVVMLSLEHDGEFGFTATLTLNLGAANTGKIANLFHFNPVTNKLEYAGSGKITSTGDTDLDFSHASDYVIVIADKDMKEEAVATDTTAENTPAAQAPNTGDSNNVSGLLLIMISCMGIAAASLFYRKKVNR